MSRAFNGITNGGDYGVGATLSAGTLPMTLAIWFYLTQTGGPNYRLMMGANAGKAGILFDPLNGYMTYAWEDTADEYNANSLLAISINKWYLGAVVITTTAATLYLGNDGLISTFTNTKTHINKSFTHWWLGGDDRGTPYNSWKGRLAHAAVWASALTAAQIQSLANGWQPGKIGGALLWWPTYGLVSPELDFSGNGYNLTINGTSQGASDPAVGLSPVQPASVNRAINRASNW